MTEPIKTSGLNEILLADIWRAFAIYDRSATNAQNRFFILRLLIVSVISQFALRFACII
jgi:hypothetical protein